MPEVDPDNLQYQCCFCGKGITKASEGGPALDPCAVVLISKFEHPEHEQGVQQFFCHLVCFEEHGKYGQLKIEVMKGDSD
jgi:hypothetical protein